MENRKKNWDNKRKKSEKYNYSKEQTKENRFHYSEKQIITPKEVIKNDGVLSFEQTWLCRSATCECD